MLGFTIMDEFPSLVSEWMENGTVTQFMAMRPDSCVSSMVRMHILIFCAKYKRDIRGIG